MSFVMKIYTLTYIEYDGKIYMLLLYHIPMMKSLPILEGVWNIYDITFIY